MWSTAQVRTAGILHSFEALWAWDGRGLDGGSRRWRRRRSHRRRANTMAWVRMSTTLYSRNKQASTTAALSVSAEAQVWLCILHPVREHFCNMDIRWKKCGYPSYHTRKKNARAALAKMARMREKFHAPDTRRPSAPRRLRRVRHALARTRDRQTDANARCGGQEKLQEKCSSSRSRSRRSRSS